MKDITRSELLDCFLTGLCIAIAISICTWGAYHRGYDKGWQDGRIEASIGRMMR